MCQKQHDSEFIHYKPELYSTETIKKLPKISKNQKKRHLPYILIDTSNVKKDANFYQIINYILILMTRTCVV